MPRKIELLSITVVTDDETGMYAIGELDFGVSGHCKPWFEADPKNRKILTEFLTFLALACKQSRAPFRDPSLANWPPPPKQEGDGERSTGYEEGAKCQR